MDQNIARKPIWTFLIFPFFLVLVLALVFFVNEAFSLGLNRYGLRPHDFSHVYGIFTFFFLHGSLEHLFNNAVAILVLTSLLRYFFPTIFFRMLSIAIIVPAVLTFFLGEPGTVHIGASGAVYALAVFLFVSAIIKMNRYLLAMSMLIAFLYGGLWWGVFPIEEHVSFEGHLAGALTGFVFSLIFIKAPVNVLAKEPEPNFDDENQPDLIGDSWKVTQDVQITYTYTDSRATSDDASSKSSKGSTDSGASRKQGEERQD